MRLRLIILGFLSVWFMPQLAHAFAIAPATIELSADRGERIITKMKIVNPTANDQKYYLDLLSFTPSENEDGIPIFSNELTTDGLTSWISFPIPSPIVQAGSTLEVPINVFVPLHVVSGSYYAAVTVSDAPSEIVATNGASINAKTAMLIFLTVKGETVSQASILDLTRSSSNIWQRPASISWRVQNQGNVFFKPQGELVVKDLFGRTVGEYEANLDDGRVLPSATRRFDIMLSQTPTWVAFGPMSASLVITDADGQNPHSESIKFWYVPWQAIVGFILILLIISRTKLISL